MAVEDPLHHAAGAMLLVGFVFSPAQQHDAEAGRPGEREQQGSEQRGRHGDGEGAEECAGEAGGGDEGQKDDDGRDGGTDQRLGDFSERLANRLGARLAAVAMHYHVLDHHDGVVDDEADGRGQAAEGHQVEAFADAATTPEW